MNLVEIFELFPTEDACLSFLEQARWKNEPRCPYCKSTKATPMLKENRHHCNSCNTSFSVTVGTIFHNTKLPLQKWFLAVCLMLNAKKGLSARQLSRDLKVNKDTAWRISMKIREAMYESEQRNMLHGIVEVDETYIGGKPRKTGPDDKHHPRGRGTKKIPVLGMVERNGKVKARVVRKDQLQSRKLQQLIRRNVDITNTTLMTDQFGGYIRIKQMMPHKVINHSVWYVDGNTHTNTIESFWALLKRGIVGQYHKVSLRYLPRYITEFCYRYNHRKHEDLFNYTILRGLGVAR
jgi:transposase-like protein